MGVDDTIKSVQAAGETRGKLYQIHKELNLPYSWLKKLADGVIKNPQAKRIEKLSDYFQKEREST